MTQDKKEVLESGIDVPQPITKLSEKEITTFKGNVDNIIALRDRLLNLSYEKLAIESNINKVYTDIQTLENLHSEFMRGIETKYGKGTLNINTFEFLPLPDEEKK